MSQRFWRRRSDASSIQPQLPFSNEEAVTDDALSVEHSSNRPVDLASRAARNTISGPGLSSSFKTPTRSYIHHASHSAQGQRRNTTGEKKKYRLTPKLRTGALLFLWRPRTDCRTLLIFPERLRYPRAAWKYPESDRQLELEEQYWVGEHLQRE